MAWKYHTLIERGSIHQVLDWLNRSEPNLDIVQMDEVPGGWRIIHRTQVETNVVPIEPARDKRLRYFMVGVPSRYDYNSKDWISYIKTAIGGWVHGGDPEDEIWDIDRDQVHVTPMERSG